MPKQREEGCIGLITLLTPHYASEYFPRFALPSATFRFKIFRSTFYHSPINSFFRSFCFKLCFHYFEFLISKIKTKLQLSFTASVLKDVTNFQPIYCQLSVLFGHYWSGNLDRRAHKEFFLIKSNAFFPSPPSLITQWFLKIHWCYISPKMDCVSSGIPDQIILLLDSSPSLDKIEKKWKRDNCYFLIIFAIMKSFSGSCSYLDSGINSQQWKVHVIGAESILKGLPLTSKAASGFFGQVVWYWLKGNVSRFEKIYTDTNNRGFT